MRIQQRVSAFLLSTHPSPYYLLVSVEYVER